VLKVSFSSEVSQDQGGISREFFTQITKDMLSSGIGLFATGNTEEFSYIVAKDSREIQDYRQLYKFFGKLIGKAFFDRIPVNLCLNRQIYNALLEKTSIEDYANLEEFKEIDVSVYHSLKFFRDNDLSQHEDIIEQYFEHTLDESGYQVELRPGGSSERVTNENKKDFIKLKSHYIAYKSA
jgi:E3 ubiquitin-protein ligase NEDD4